MREQRRLRRDKLFDYLVANPQVTLRQIERHLGVSKSAAETSIRDLRLLFGDLDDITLICEPDGKGRPWLYRLVGNATEAFPYQSARLLHVEAELVTLEAQSRSIARSTDGRTIEGKKADLIESTVGYLNRELRRLNGELF